MTYTSTLQNTSFLSILSRICPVSIPSSSWSSLTSNSSPLFLLMDLISHSHSITSVFILLLLRMPRSWVYHVTNSLIQLLPRMMMVPSRFSFCRIGTNNFFFHCSFDSSASISSLSSICPMMTISISSGLSTTSHRPTLLKFLAFPWSISAVICTLYNPLHCWTALSLQTNRSTVRLLFAYQWHTHDCTWWHPCLWWYTADHLTSTWPCW